jgi:hypothetical protein
MLADARGRLALVASALMHAAVALAAGFSGQTLARDTRDALDRPDRWGGDTFDIDGLVARPSVAATVSPPPAAPAPAEPAQADPPPQAPARESPKAVEPREVAAAAEATKARSPPETTEPHSKATAPPESGAPAAPAAGTSFGASGLEPGVRNLGKAFTRALPVGARADAAWFRLPSGAAGGARITITIDDHGRIERAEPLPIEVGARVPSHLARLLDRVVLLLRAGRFALDHGDEPSGRETLRVEAELREGAAVDEFAEPQHTVDMGFEPPTRARAGKAWFSYASGRRVELRVTIEAP